MIHDYEQTAKFLNGLSLEELLELLEDIRTKIVDKVCQKFIDLPNHLTPVFNDTCVDSYNAMLAIDWIFNESRQPEKSMDERKNLIHKAIGIFFLMPPEDMPKEIYHLSQYTTRWDDGGFEKNEAICAITDHLLKESILPPYAVIAILIQARNQANFPKIMNETRYKLFDTVIELLPALAKNKESEMTSMLKSLKGKDVFKNFIAERLDATPNDNNDAYATTLRLCKNVCDGVLHERDFVQIINRNRMPIPPTADPI